MVATLPMLAEVATASRYGSGFNPACSEEYERHHYQADNVVDEKRREHAGDEDDSRQQVARLQTCHDLLGYPLEKTCQVQVADQQHHGEQQYERAEVDKAQRFGGGHNPECNHQYRTDDGHAGSIDLHPGQLA